MVTVAEHTPPPDDAAVAAPARSQTVTMIVSLSVAAGLIHAVAMVNHFAEWWAYGVFFLIVMCAQLLWAGWLYRHPDDQRTLALGALASLAVVALWIETRTIGLPFGPEAGTPETVGGMDLMSSLDQIITAALVATILAPTSPISRRLKWLTGSHSAQLSSVFFSASLFAILLSGHH